jgi:hypothetical protein
MTLATSVEITGLKQALAELSKVDKSARFKAAAKIKASSPAMLEEARNQFPPEIGVSMIKGMGNKGRLGYNKAAVDKGVQIMVGGRARGKGITPLVTLVQKNAAGALFSQAGSKNVSDFSKLLTNVFGRPQRGLWRSRQFITEQGTADIIKAVDEVIADANRALKARQAA